MDNCSSEIVESSTSFSGTVLNDNKIGIDIKSGDLYYKDYSTGKWILYKGGTAIPPPPVIPAQAVSKVKTSTQNSTIGSMANVSELVQFASGGKKYKYEANLWIGCDTVNGVKIGLNSPSTPNIVYTGGGNVLGIGPNNVSVRLYRLPDIAGTSAGVFNTAIAAGVGLVSINVVFSTTGNANINVAFSPQTPGDTASIYAGSYSVMTEIL